MVKLAAVLLSSVVAVSGCSLFAVRTSKSKYDVGCTSDLYAPALDLGAAATNAYAAAAYDEARWLSLLGMAAFTASAVHGYLATGTCVRTKNAAWEHQTDLLDQIDLNLRNLSNADKPLPRRKPTPVEDADDAPSVKPSGDDQPSRP